ncbi:hypothetical protein C7M84_014481 [Penaeus vannamei]|uniref:Uncharacterized protein n=1 Tax=Penaeus vannamei TaxID=6689 RepID=A0A423STB9_PENVA|nr:hypothetical protein C7M84_014481 [Penaeus vannamei]
MAPPEGKQPKGTDGLPWQPPKVVSQTKGTEGFKFPFFTRVSAPWHLRTAANSKPQRRRTTPSLPIGEARAEDRAPFGNLPIGNFKIARGDRLLALAPPEEQSQQARRAGPPSAHHADPPPLSQILPNGNLKGPDWRGSIAGTSTPERQRQEGTDSKGLGAPLAPSSRRQLKGVLSRSGRVCTPLFGRVAYLSEWKSLKADRLWAPPWLLLPYRHHIKGNSKYGGVSGGSLAIPSQLKGNGSAWTSLCRQPPKGNCKEDGGLLGTSKANLKRDNPWHNKHQIKATNTKEREGGAPWHPPNRQLQRDGRASLGTSGRARTSTNSATEQGFTWHLRRAKITPRRRGSILVTSRRQAQADLKAKKKSWHGRLLLLTPSKGHQTHNEGTGSNLLRAHLPQVNSKTVEGNLKGAGASLGHILPKGNSNAAGLSGSTLALSKCATTKGTVRAKGSLWAPPKGKLKWDGGSSLGTSEIDNSKGTLPSRSYSSNLLHLGTQPPKRQLKRDGSCSLPGKAPPKAILNQRVTGAPWHSPHQASNSPKAERWALWHPAKGKLKVPHGWALGAPWQLRMAKLKGGTGSQLRHTREGNIHKGGRGSLAPP